MCDHPVVNCAMVCVVCGNQIEEEGIVGGLARSTDPEESHIAAAKISHVVTEDRLLVLRAFDDLGKGTFREAARRALQLQQKDGTSFTLNETRRLESLRRRGSDLKALDWVEQDGRYDGQAQFKVTELGHEELLGV